MGRDESRSTSSRGTQYHKDDSTDAEESSQYEAKSDRFQPLKKEVGQDQNNKRTGGDKRVDHSNLSPADGLEHRYGADALADARESADTQVPRRRLAEVPDHIAMGHDHQNGPTDKQREGRSYQRRDCLRYDMPADHVPAGKRGSCAHGRQIAKPIDYLARRGLGRSRSGRDDETEAAYYDGSAEAHQQVRSLSKDSHSEARGEQRLDRHDRSHPRRPYSGYRGVVQKPRDGNTQDPQEGEPGEGRSRQTSELGQVECQSQGHRHRSPNHN